MRDQPIRPAQRHAHRPLRRLAPALALGALLMPVIGLATSASATDEQVLDEVLVQGRSNQLEQLRQQMIKLEDTFYARFNELNDNDLFDVHRLQRAITGSRLERRFCRAVFESYAHETEGRQHAHALQYQATNLTAMEWIAPIPATVAVERRKLEFRETLERVTSNNPELLELLRQRAELAKRYTEIRGR